LEAETVTQIFLTSDQSRQFASATDGVVFCDDSGNVIVRVLPVPTTEAAPIVAEARRRLASNQPRRSSTEVLARLGSREPR
jgi:hypothetical protein